ncbi:MAG TPA: hypothetical protein VGB63_16310 [Pedobacter sp.]|jgi:hypothetical protein
MTNNYQVLHIFISPVVFLTRHCSGFAQQPEQPNLENPKNSKLIPIYPMLPFWQIRHLPAVKAALGGHASQIL